MTVRSSRWSAAVLLAAVLALTASCGGDPGATYCSALSDKREVFSTDSTPAQFVANLPALEALRAKAPDDLADEWQVFLAAMKDLRSAIAAAGIQPGDINGGARPAGVTDAQWAAIRSAADGLASAAVTAALNGIEQQAKDVCKLQLGL